MQCDHCSSTVEDMSTLPDDTTIDVVLHDLAAQTVTPAVEAHDLRALFQAVGSFTSERALISSPYERPEPDEEVAMVDNERARIVAQPLGVIGFTDGIQSAMTVTYRDHRPVYLTYVAAGCVGPSGSMLASRERLDIVCSHLDSEWVESLGTTIPTILLPEERPDIIERAALGTMGADRERMERDLMEELSMAQGGYIVVDGSIAHRQHDELIVGVVKTTRRRWLKDESVLWGLPEGWRSPIFSIGAGVHGAPGIRYSCYLRLFDASKRGWDFGLIRLEAWKPELLEPLAALCMQERQHPRSGDSRGDRHLASVRVCEQVLRARRPAVFTL